MELISGSLGSAGALVADGDTDKGSPIGLFIVLILIVAVYFLYRSMSRHINRLPDSFSSPDGPRPAGQPQQPPAANSGTDRATLSTDPHTGGADPAARRIRYEAGDTPQP